MADPREESRPSTPTATETSVPAGDPSQRIGPYRLLERVGEGGMGVVWRAEQTEPLRREVALKVIKAGMDSAQIVARFEAERQALALMDHPAIAKVHDAGTTPRGLPYFAMEYVRGEPITAYCDRHRLTMQQRLELFREVCEGVQHAHQKGVIHRDLKPSNVLATVVGDRPMPKIIDFGVAKATAQRLTARTIFTEQGVLIGTPEYMSPEQVEMTGLDIDTRTDVYALGVMLYELLTGFLPFEPSELRQAGWEAIRHVIREVEPPRPSTRVRTLKERSSQAARDRQTDPGRLVSRLQGDLDWIVMKALEKDRTRRYGSPSDLAADLARHLGNQPVLAGPPGARYRAGKFVRRHRFGVAASAAALVLLVGFALTMAWQARRTARERDRAERVSQFLVELFRVSDPGQARGNTITAREVLDRSAGRIDQGLRDEPQVQADLMHTLGRVYLNLGLYDESERLLRRAVGLRTSLFGGEDVRTLDSRNELAWLYRQQGRYRESEALFREVHAGRRRALGEDDAATIRSLNGIAVGLEQQGKFEEAAPMYQEVLDRSRRALGERDDMTVWALHNVAEIQRSLGRTREALAMFEEALDARRRLSGPDHPDSLWVMNNMAFALQEADQLDRAEGLVREVLDRRRRVLGEEHPHTLESANLLAIVYARQRRFAEAARLHEATLEARLRILGPEHPRTLASMNNLAGNLASLGELERAASLHERTLQIQRRVLGEEHPHTLASMNNLAAAFMGLKRYEEAARLLSDAHATSRRLQGPESERVADMAYNLACLAALRGRRSEALDWLEKSLPGTGAPSMAEDADLASLRGDPEFERLAAAARAKRAAK